MGGGLACDTALELSAVCEAVTEASWRGETHNPIARPPARPPARLPGGLPFPSLLSSLLFPWHFGYVYTVQHHGPYSVYGRALTPVPKGLLLCVWAKSEPPSKPLAQNGVPYMERLSPSTQHKPPYCISLSLSPSQMVATVVKEICLCLKL